MAGSTKNRILLGAFIGSRNLFQTEGLVVYCWRGFRVVSADLEERGEVANELLPKVVRDVGDGLARRLQTFGFASPEAAEAAV